jgi:DNA-binding response OmpR family regulator
MKSFQASCDPLPTLSKPTADGMPVTGRQTVLIVNDDAYLRDTCWVALLEAGYRGVATANSNNVLDIMYAENVSVILLDLKPEMDGIESLRSIKRVSPEILVVAMSEDGGHLDLATQLGADGFIRKPASAAAIVEVVSNLVSRSSNASQTDRRRYTRLQVNQKGYLYNPPHEPLECRVVNLSAGGALVQTESKCPSDRPLILYVDGFGNFEGMVVHSTDGSIGFRFLMGELKRDRLKQALASFAKYGIAPIGTYGKHPNFKSVVSG